MNEKLKNAILENEDLLELLLAIHFNNITVAEDEAEEEKDFNTTEYLKGNFNEPFKDASYFDLDYNIALLNKWKNSNALDKLNEALERNPLEFTEEEIKDAKEKYEEIAEAERGLYKDELDFLESSLNINFLNKAYFVLYDAGLSGCFVILFAISKLLYTINKYKDTPIAEVLRNYLKEVINEKEVNTTNKDVLERMARENLDFNAFYHNVKIGIAFSEIMLTASRESYFTKNSLDEATLNYRENQSNILEDLGAKNKEPKEVVADYLLELKNFKRLEKLFTSVADEIGLFISEVLERNNLTLQTAYTVADDKKIRQLTTNTINELATTSLEEKERTKSFKNYAIIKLLSILALDSETKELVEDALNLLEPRKTKEEIRRESYLTFNDLEPVGKEWTKVNVSEYNTAIMNLHTGIATYNENNIEAKQRNLNTINYKINKLEEEDILTDEQLLELAELEQEREVAEEELDQATKHLEEIEAKIKEEEEELSKASKELIALNDAELTRKEMLLETKKLKRKIKDLTTSIAIHKKAKESRGLYLQLAQDEGRSVITAKEDFKGGSVVMYIDNKVDIEKHFTREATRFLRYLQGIAYNLPFEKYKKEDIPIILDLDDYLEETGRKHTALKSVKRQLEQALDLLHQEYYRINGKSKKYNLNITGKIELIGDYFYIEPLEEANGIVNSTNKTTFAIYLGSTYKKILFNEAVMQWASIPKLLNKLTDKEIKKKGYNTKLEVVQDLGYYLYDTLRKNLNKEGYYKRTFTLKTLVEQLTKNGALATNKTNTYNRRVIEPLEDALNFLQEELKLISYSTQAFSIYAGDIELGEKGLAGSKEGVIKKAFESAKITITFKVYDKATYDRIAEQNKKGRARAKRLKEARELKKIKQIELLEDADFIEK